MAYKTIALPIELKGQLIKKFSEGGNRTHNTDVKDQGLTFLATSQKNYQQKTLQLRGIEPPIGKPSRFTVYRNNHSATTAKMPMAGLEPTCPKGRKF